MATKKKLEEIRVSNKGEAANVKTFLVSGTVTGTFGDVESLLINTKYNAEDYGLKLDLFATPEEDA